MHAGSIPARASKHIAPISLHWATGLNALPISAHFKSRLNGGDQSVCPEIDDYWNFVNAFLSNVLLSQSIAVFRIMLGLKTKAGAGQCAFGNNASVNVIPCS